MKKGFALLLICLIGCQQFERGLVEPALLFRTWQKTEGINNGQPTKYPLLVEFTRDGKLLYGTEKRDGWCCAPSLFRSGKNKIEFLFANPADPQCALVNCALSELTTGVVWQINKLTNNELTISTDTQSIKFEAVK